MNLRPTGCEPDELSGVCRAAARRACAAAASEQASAEARRRGLPSRSLTDVDAWLAELDRFADVPLMEDGRRQPPMPEPDEPI